MGNCYTDPAKSIPILGRIKNDDVQLYNELLPYCNMFKTKIQIKIYFDCTSNKFKSVDADDINYGSLFVNKFIILGTGQIYIYCNDYNKICPTFYCNKFIHIYPESIDPYINSLSNNHHINECKILFALFSYIKYLNQMEPTTDVFAASNAPNKANV